MVTDVTTENYEGYASYHSESCRGCANALESSWKQVLPATRGLFAEAADPALNPKT